MTQPAPGTSQSRLLVYGLLAAFLLEGVFFVTHGRFNIDEGLHLNAGRLIYERGQMLYRDLPFSQGPGGPYLYGLASAALENAVLAGRCLSLALGLVCVTAMAWFAGRMVGAVGAVLVLLWTAIAFPAVWSFTQVRTEPAAMALATLATIALFYRRQATWGGALAPSLLVWATTFRLSYALPLVAVCLLVGFDLRHSPRRLIGAAAIVLGNGLLAWWPMWAFPQESFFHVVASQAGRAERFGWTTVPFLWRFHFLWKPETGYPALLALCAIPLSLIVSRWRGGWRPWRGDPRDPAAVLAVLLAMALLTYAPQVPSQQGFAQYFANAALLLILALAIAAPVVARRSRSHRIAVGGALAAAWTLSAAMGLRQIETWVHLDGPTVTRFHALRESVERLAPGGCTMLTFETHVAVQVGCDVPPGLEYSYFSFFPSYSDERARARGVANRGLVIGHLRRDRPDFVALDWRAVYLITGTRPDRTGTPVLPEMRGRYRLLSVLDVPIGPTYIFWNQVFVYARSDLEGPRDGAT